MPLPEKSQHLVNVWAEIFDEYLHRAGIAEPCDPFYMEQGLEPSEENIIASRSHGAIFSQTDRLQKALGATTADLQEALRPHIARRYSSLRVENPDLYINGQLEDFAKTLATGKFPLYSRDQDMKRRLETARYEIPEEPAAGDAELDTRAPDYFNGIRRYMRNLGQARLQIPYLDQEREVESWREALDAAMEQTVRKAEKTVLEGTFGERKHLPAPGQDQSPGLDHGKT
ncbi:MAG: hypothetical protein PW734_11655 [Verrucomicrobium sp.]|nr:hypothetical protein [Verrucomicrobium sp.]